MPEHVAPGVFVEEVDAPSRPIEGVSTSTTAFVGTTRRGPVGEVSELLNSFADFERTYGGLHALSYLGASDPGTNYLAHAVRAYFDNGGARLFVARVAASGSATAAGRNLITAAGKEIRFVARWPGAAGNAAVRVRELVTPASVDAAAEAPEGSLMRLQVAANGGDHELAYFIKRGSAWFGADNSAKTFAAPDEAAGMAIVALEVVIQDADGDVSIHKDLGFDPAHARYIGGVLAERPARGPDAQAHAHALQIRGGVTPFEIRSALLQSGGSFTMDFAPGTDVLPDASDYQRALALLEAFDDVSIVAAPGSSAIASMGQVVAQHLIAHAHRPRACRIAVLDTPPAQTPAQVEQLVSGLDSQHAALYYPWLVVASSTGTGAPGEVALPPSGFVCGIYARNDRERGVWKAPANLAVRGALRIERALGNSERAQLDPLGVNCLRTLPGAGLVVWGARTTSRDSELRYVNIRRYIDYLERSIERGTQWAALEPNGELLWSAVRTTVTSFLLEEWHNGALAGASPAQAFFVSCDRTTMTQEDVDNGRLVCLVGIAAIKPAEFMFIRIGQSTADPDT